MSTLGVIALVLAAVVVAAAIAVTLVLRRRSSDEVTGSPRTVADLVRLRAEQAADATPVVPEPPAAEVPAADVDQPTGSRVPGAVVGGPPVEAPSPEPVAAPPVVNQPVVHQPAAGLSGGNQPAPPHTGSDTPWGRAARMTGGDGVVWATADTDHEWSGWADWADVDDTGSGVPAAAEPGFRPVILPAVSPELFGTRVPPHLVPAPVPDPAPEETAAAAEEPAVTALPVRAEPLALAPPTPPEPAEAPAADPSDTAPDPTTEEPAVRRHTPAETAAEQAAADLALLRTFGSAPDAYDDDDDALMSPPTAVLAAPATGDGVAQPVAFRVVGRDGAGLEGAGVTLLDDLGRETTGTVADADGCGEVSAPHPGSYVLVSSAPGHQPGAVAITVTDAPVKAEVLLARSASVAGTVNGEDGPIVGARLTLVQDGEIVDTTGTGPTGEYWIADLAAGDYGLSVTAAECEPVAVLLTVPDETDMRHDLELIPAGLPAPAVDHDDDDVMIGQM